MVHIGKEIEKKVRESRMPATEFARKIDTSRNNIYNIYARKTIDTGLLLRISKVLSFDFFQLYLDPKTRNKELEHLHTQVEQLTRENELLKKVNTLLEKQNTKPGKSVKKKK